MLVGKCDGDVYRLACTECKVGVMSWAQFVMQNSFMGTHFMGTSPESQTISLNIMITGLLSCILFCSFFSFQERIMFADLLAVEEMKSLIMWSCSFRWVLFFASPVCPIEMASLGRVYIERLRPSTDVKTWLHTVGGMEDSEKGGCCSDIPWDGSSHQYVLKYFIALL